MSNVPSPAYPMRPLIEVIGLPSPDLARRLVTLLDLAEPCETSAPSVSEINADAA
ncbi:hypothetical protein ABZV14_01215 [Streptosporangium canum]|uniref:hypothetical protein n=1 Tax=Streptosporangium canum TaxID=324952 RepID=UPI0033B127A0